MADADQAGLALFHQWLKRCRESQLAHYAAAERSSLYHLLIGIPAATISAIVGTTVFSALDAAQSLDVRLRFLIGFISIAAAVLTGCQTFLRLSEKADSHRTYAAKYAALRRQLETTLAYPDLATEERAEIIRGTFDDLAANAPNVPNRVWQAALKNAGDDYLFSNKSV